MISEMRSALPLSSDHPLVAVLRPAAVRRARKVLGAEDIQWRALYTRLRPRGPRFEGATRLLVAPAESSEQVPTAFGEENKSKTPSPGLSKSQPGGVDNEMLRVRLALLTTVVVVLGSGARGVGSGKALLASCVTVFFNLCSHAATFLPPRLWVKPPSVPVVSLFLSPVPSVGTDGDGLAGLGVKE